ncbi:MAG: tRNA (N(6)-L-threonylcarbamoyladenosine(37)-C(2))-methylthiotransferase MtaB [Treponema sp.]|jgi:threonylcarbamoyladenosine tRNA methylthiotransferase MtaB|nr:tRNA (N(6)-L-threonylcarbamoyladenosine(37)-C(2))-methylthiotransferase MtaB [Treponema sp.]
MLSLSVYTLGCKLNQAESEAVAAAFKREGFQVAPWGSATDILAVNTCTVTSKAEQKARRIIRAALRANPRSCVIVTGCYAQVARPALEALADAASRAQGRFFVLNGDLKSALLDLPGFIRRNSGNSAPDPEQLPALLGQWERVSPSAAPDDRFRFNGEDLSFHSRPFLKIQDGCNHACSYCRVPLARGKSVSLEAGQVLARLKALEARGFGEAVLTGVNIGCYDAGGFDLAMLLSLLLRETRSIAIRLSSLEPQGLRPALLDALADGRIRPHFHLSVQSGSPAVLRRMRRTYGPGEVVRAAEQLRALKGDPFLACDMIAGFPGERDGDFRQSYELCQRLDFAWIHPFPYSRRPGTEAAGFEEAVPEREAAARVKALTALAHEGRKAYIARWLGKTVEAIPESGAALSANYLRLLVPATVAERRFLCRIQSLPLADRRFDAQAIPIHTS